MTVGQFFGTLTKPIEYIWDKIRGIDQRVEKIVKDEAAVTPEFVATLKEAVAKGEALFQSVTQAAAHRGVNWTDDTAAVQAVEDFLPVFKNFSVEVSKAFEIIKNDVDAPLTPETPETSETSETSETVETDGAQHDALGQVAAENQELNKEEQQSENDDATRTAAEHEAIAPGNDETNWNQ